MASAFGLRVGLGPRSQLFENLALQQNSTTCGEDMNGARISPSEQASSPNLAHDALHRALGVVVVKRKWDTGW